MNFRIFSTLLFGALLTLYAQSIFSMYGGGGYAGGRQHPLIPSGRDICNVDFGDDDAEPTGAKAQKGRGKHPKRNARLKRIREERERRRQEEERALRPDSGPDGKSPLLVLEAGALQDFASLVESNGLLAAVLALESSPVAKQLPLATGTEEDVQENVYEDVEEEDVQEEAPAPLGAGTSATPAGTPAPDGDDATDTDKRKEPTPTGFAAAAAAGSHGTKRNVGRPKGLKKGLTKKRRKDDSDREDGIAHKSENKLVAKSKDKAVKKGPGHKKMVSLDAECTSCTKWCKLKLSLRVAKAVTADNYWLCKACAKWLTCSQCGCMHKISQTDLATRQTANIDFSEDFTCEQNSWNGTESGVREAIAKCAKRK